MSHVVKIEFEFGDHVSLYVSVRRNVEVFDEHIERIQEPNTLLIVVDQIAKLWVVKIVKLYCFTSNDNERKYLRQ